MLLISLVKLELKCCCIHCLQVKLYNEKRSDLEEQQLHLNVGLQKIRETVDQVEELQSSLSIKKNELEQKNALANQKLKQMVKDQQEAEKKKVASQEIQEMLIVQNKSVAQKKEIVLRDLSKVEPAVKEAQQGVWGGGGGGGVGVGVCVGVRVGVGVQVHATYMCACVWYCIYTLPLS